MMVLPRISSRGWRKRYSDRERREVLLPSQYCYVQPKPVCPYDTGFNLPVVTVSGRKAQISETEQWEVSEHSKWALAIGSSRLM